MTWLALLLLSFLPQDTRPVARIDVLERNRVFTYERKPQLRLDQVIGWTYRDYRYHAEWWKWSQDMHGLRYANGKWRCIIDGVVVEADQYVETWSTYDREIFDRDEWPLEWRRGLDEHARGWSRLSGCTR